MKFLSVVSEKKSKMSQQIWGQGSHIVFPISPKNTNLVEHIEILLPVKFLWIRFSGFRGEVKNVSANQRPGRPSWFSDRPEKHKLGRAHWDLTSCQVSLNSLQRFKRRSQKCLSQSELGAAILFFRTAPKNTNLVEDVEILLPVKFRWILLSRFRGEVKNVKVNDGRTDGRRTTDDGQRMITIVHLSLRLRCTKNCGKLCISSILSSKRGITPTKIDTNWQHLKVICSTVK